MIETLERPTRPVMRYHGGKWRIAPWIISHFPEHRIYCEPFCGAASVFMRKSRVHAEVINDIDGDIVNLFKVLRDPERARRLENMVRLTPFAREEFLLSYEESVEPVERARRTLVRASMGFGTTAHRKSRTGFRARTYQRNQTGPADWASWPEQIRLFIRRLAGVIVENLDAVRCIQLHDSTKTLFYVDPPYLASTRTSGMRGYRYEFSDEDHRRLLDCLIEVKGKVVISGYENDLYDRLLQGWNKEKKSVLADGGARRTEIIWTNFDPEVRQYNLFGMHEDRCF